MFCQTNRKRYNFNFILITEIYSDGILSQTAPKSDKLITESILVLVPKKDKFTSKNGRTIHGRSTSAKIKHNNDYDRLVMIMMMIMCGINKNVTLYHHLTHNKLHNTNAQKTNIKHNSIMLQTLSVIKRSSNTEEKLKRSRRRLLLWHLSTAQLASH